MTIVRAADPLVRDLIVAATRTMMNLTADRFADLTVKDIVSRLWPPTHGWEVLSTEIRFGKLLVLLAHPEHGVGVTLLTIDVNLYRPGALETEWVDVADGTLLAEELVYAVHAQGPTRVDVLSQIEHATTTFGRRMTYFDAHLVDRLTTNPTFMDPETSMLLGLDLYTDLRARAEDVINGNV